jgi:DNA-binding GntR family transcriptional regulator
MSAADPDQRGGVRPVGALSLVDQVTKELRRSILSGDLPPGAEFSLRDIAGRLQVSFIPVREALRTLEEQGLVVTRPGRSAIVAPLDAEDLHGIYRLRLIIEPELASRASALLTEQDRKPLEALIDALADPTHGFDAQYESHQRFHFELIRPAATAWDLRVLQTLWNAAERYVRHSFGHNLERPELDRRAETHHVLLDAMLSGDPDSGARAYVDHLTLNEQIAARGIGDAG